MELKQCPRCGFDLSAPESSPIAKRFFEIMKQIDEMNHSFGKSALVTELTDEDFEKLFTNERIEQMQSLIDRHNKIG